jgi:2-polyprenyl-3-methyl-5-hydroxy-6-metoxy-1,4-benzoquinol methylase
MGNLLKNKYIEFLAADRSLFDDDNPDGERKYILDNAQRYIHQMAIVEEWKQKMGNGPSGLQILDLGCYPGHLAILLRHYIGATVTGAGITVNDLFLRRMNDFKIVFTPIDFEQDTLPFENCSFDVVLFTEVIEHMLNPFPVGREITRVLRPGGLLLLSTPNLASLRNRIALARGKTTNPEYFMLADRVGPVKTGANVYPAHVRLWTPTELRSFFDRLCITVVNEAYQNWRTTDRLTVKEMILQALMLMLPAHMRDMVTMAGVKK